MQKISLLQRNKKIETKSFQAAVKHVSVSRVKTFEQMIERLQIAQGDAKIWYLKHMHNTEKLSKLFSQLPSQKHTHSPQNIRKYAEAAWAGCEHKNVMLARLNAQYAITLPFETDISIIRSTLVDAIVAANK